MTPTRTTFSIVALVALCLCLPAVTETTHAAFLAGFSGSVEASGKIDIAQSSAPDGQHPTDRDASELKDNGAPVRVLTNDESDTHDRTTRISMPVVNRSDDAIVTMHLFVRPRAGNQLLAYLRMSAQLSTEDTASGLVPGDAATEDSQGLDIPGALSPGAKATVNVSVWLADDAPDSALGEELDLVFRLVGETSPGDTPIDVEGAWT